MERILQDSDWIKLRFKQRIKERLNFESFKRNELKNKLDCSHNFISQKGRVSNFYNAPLLLEEIVSYKQ